jgi:hypothetical protein
VVARGARVSAPSGGFKHRVIDELWRVTAATSAKSIGTAITSDAVIEQIRKELRRQTGHNMDPAELRDLIKSSVLRPDALWTGLTTSQAKDAVTGSQRGSHPGERLRHHANGSVQESGDDASSRTDPDNNERLTGIYGSDVSRAVRSCESRGALIRGERPAVTRGG